MAKVLLKPRNAEPLAVDLSRGHGPEFTAEVNSQQVKGMVQECPGGELVLHLGDRIVPFYHFRNDSMIEVWIAGRTYSFELLGTKSRSTAGAAGQIAEEILAPMPGTVLKIQVQIGDEFAAHQPLIIMESMKMEMTLSAPHPGRVQQIDCTVGELVPMGKILLKLESLHEHAALSSPGKDR